MVQSSAFVHAGDEGSALYQSCLAAVRTFDNPTGSSQTDIAHSYSCYAYIQSFTDGSNSNGHAFCNLGGTVGTGIRIYVAYMQKNPKLLDDYKAEGVLKAFSEAYRCSTKPK
jgi:hypothetical protein